MPTGAPIIALVSIPWRIRVPNREPFA